MVIYIFLLCKLSGEIKLEANVNLTLGEGKGGVHLRWGNNSKPDHIFYRIFQKSSENDEWQTVGTHKKDTFINVLNIYPTNSTEGQIRTTAKSFPTYNVTMSFATDPNGQEYIYPKSASLKSWMEGGTVDGINFSPIGVDINTKQQLMNITLKSIDEFEVTIRQNPSWIYQFDVIVHGFWDANANFSLSTNSSNTTIRDYINRGYGFIAGHDILCLAFVKDKIEPTSLIAIRDLFGIKLQPIDNGKFMTIYSTNISIQKRGNILKYPWDIDGEINTTYDIYNTHTTSNAAIGDVWFSLGNTGVQFDGELKHNFYLTTYNNTAMIQLGHSECNATETEMKILANTIFYLKQRITEEEFDDYLFSNDVVPPKIGNIIFDENNYLVKINAEDYGSEYTYKVCAYNENGDLINESNNVTVNVITGIMKYMYIINENVNCNISELLYETFDDNIKITNNEIIKQLYVHVAAVDCAGNIGEIKSFQMPIISTKTFTESNSFTKSNTFSNSNTFTQSNSFRNSNTFFNSNTFTKSNSFSDSNTFTRSNLFTELFSFISSNAVSEFSPDFTFSYSYLITYLISIAKTFFNYTYMSNSYTFTFIGSKITYFNTKFIYYKYTIIFYTTYFSFYSEFFTIFQQTSLLANKSKTNVIIISIVVAILVAIIIVIALLYALIFHNRNIKHTIESEITSEVSDQQNVEVLSDFTSKVSVHNIEEDPFAADFQEDKNVNNNIFH